MEIQSLIFAIIFLPLLGSFLIPLLGWSGLKKLTGPVSVILLVATNILTWFLIEPSTREVTGQWSIQLLPWIRFSLVYDALSVFMSFTSSLIAALIAVYSLGYIAHDEHEPEYYFIVTIFVSAMMGVVFSSSLLFLYLFWEISAVACWRLIGYYREPDYIWKADKAFLVTFGGAVFMLLGFLLIYADYGTFDINELRGKPVSLLALVLILAGVFTKSATVPLHTWLPDAGVAPSTVTSLLHAALLVKIGLYAFARMFANGMIIPSPYNEIVLIIALISAFVSACAALMENNIKRLLAYSTVSHIGYIFLGLAVFTSTGYIGALLYIMAHGFAKGGLFLCAGIIEHGTGTKDMRKMGGLFRKMPVTAISYIVCALSIAGFPPMAGFFCKSMVVSGLIQGGYPYIALFAILTAVVTLIYMLKSFHAIFLGEPHGESHREGRPVMVAVVAVLSALTIIMTILLQSPYKIAWVAEKESTVAAEMHIIEGGKP
jgi:proton-translocating NADH-quinone oxidoreductase chain M